MTLKRALALAISVVLLLETALTPSLAASLTPSLPFSSLTPPEKLGTLVSAHRGTSQSVPKVPQVILIQDLHFNYSVQRNIAGLLEFLSNKSALGPAIAVEGATGGVDNSLLTDVANVKVREELADFLMQNGELTGPQFYSIMSSQPKILQGIEDPAYFQNNRDIFRLSYKQRHQASLQLQALESRLRTLVPALCSRPVQRVVRARERFEAGTLSLSRYFEILQAQGKKTNVHIPESLAAYFQGDRGQQQTQVLNGSVYHAIDDYALVIQNALAKTQTERHVVQLSKELALAGRALAQHTTFEEIQHVASRVDTIAELCDVLAGGKNTELDLDATALKEALRASVDFYVAALMRNEPMLEKTLGLQRAASSRPVVLVAGGFHTSYFTKELRARGVSYAVLTPQVDQHTAEDEALYAKRYMGQRMTPSEVIAWISAHGGNRGSPQRSEAAGVVPALSELGWLPGLKKEAVRGGSIYGNSPGVQYIQRLRETLGDLHFEGSIRIAATDLDNPIWSDERIPSGHALRDVLSLHQRYSLDTPIAEFEIVTTGQVNDGGSNVVDLDPEHMGGYMEMHPIPHTETYRAILYPENIKRERLYQANPYTFYLYMNLHETAEFGPARIPHEDLKKAGLAEDAPAIEVTQGTRTLYRHFIQLGEATPPWQKLFAQPLQDMSQGSVFRAVSAANAFVWRYLQEKAAQGIHLKIPDLTSDDWRLISSFAWRRRKIPGKDFWKGRQKEMTVLNEKDIPESVLDEAIRRRLDGRYVEEFFVGGAGTRMAEYIDKLKADRILTPEESSVFWFIPLGKLLHDYDKEGYDKFHADKVHWGARIMLRYNQSVRRLARENSFPEELALSNQRMMLHVNDETGPDIMQDFVNHGFYGFNPLNVVFSMNKQHHFLRYNAEVGSFEEDKETPLIVWGHGPATEKLVFEHHARRISSRGTVEESNQMQSSITDWLLRTLRAGTQEVIGHQVRVNNLKALNREWISTVRDAHALMQVRKGHFLLFEMVTNPDVIVHKGDRPKDKQKGGGVFYLRKDDGSTHAAVIDKLATLDEATKAHIAEVDAVAKVEGDEDLLNLMGSYYEMSAYAVAVQRGLPVAFESVAFRNRKGWFLKPQLVSGDVSIDSSLNAQAYYVPGTSLEDLKEPAWSQVVQARIKLENMQEDAEALALGLLYDLPVRTGNDLVNKVEKELVRIAAHSNSQILAGKAKHAMTVLKSQPGTDYLDTRDSGALSPAQAHQFLGVTVALSLGALVISPLAAAITLPWLIAALAHEVAVISTAIWHWDSSILTSNAPIATFSFGKDRTEQEEDVSQVAPVARTFAHAHEMARAMTQSTYAVAPRVIAPLTLPLAVVDDLVAGILNVINFLVGKPAPDAALQANLEHHQEAIEKLLLQLKDEGLSRGSRIWLEIQLRGRAVWKNSSAREAAAELAARQALAIAA